MTDNVTNPSDLHSLERRSCGLPHPLSLWTGFTLVKAGFFVPVPEPDDDAAPVFSQPFAMHWPFHGLRAGSRVLFGRVKALHQGYGLLPSLPPVPPHPPLPAFVDRLRYETVSDTAVRRRLEPDDGDARLLWAVPLYEPAHEAFLRFRRRAPGGPGAMLLAEAAAGPGALVVYRISLDAPQTPACFVFPVSREHGVDRPVGIAPTCEGAFLVAMLLRETGQGAVQRLRPVRFRPPADQADTAPDDLYSQAGDRAFGGRQDYPRVYLPPDQACRPQTPEEAYRLLCRRFADTPLSATGPEVGQGVRDLDAAVVLAEQAPACPGPELEGLWRRLEAIETQWLPLYMGVLGLVRDKVRAAPGDEPAMARGVLAAFVDEVQSGWRNLHDIRFRRLPALGRSRGQGVVLRSGSGPGLGPFRGPGDAVALPGGDVVFVSVPRAGALLRFDGQARKPRRVKGPWRGLGRLRADGDGLWLLDPLAGNLVRLSSLGETVDVRDAGLGKLAGGPCTVEDFLVAGSHLFIAAVSADGAWLRCLDLPADGGRSRLAFSLERDAFPFEVWDVWGRDLVLVASKTASLYVWKAADGTWDRHDLPLRHSFCQGLAIRGDLAVLRYPPDLVVYDLRRRRLLDACHAPSVVGQWPGPRTFAAGPIGRERLELLVGDDQGRLMRHTLDLAAVAPEEQP